MNFNANLSSFLAHSIVYFSRCESNVDLMMCGGDAAAPSSSESMQSILKAYKENLPDLLSEVNAQIVPASIAELQAAQATSAPYAQLQADLYKQFAPGLAKTASDIETQTALASAQRDADVLAGPGRNLIDQALAVQKTADPEYYAARTLTGDKLSELLSGINTTSLSPNERREVDTAIARGNLSSGNATSGSITNTVANAGQYGDALRAKQNQLAQALGVASQVTPTLKSNFDPTQVALGRSSQAINLAQTNFTGNSKASNTASQFGSSLLDNLTQLKSTEMDINANRRDPFDRFAQGFSAGKPNCCFIFMEAYNGCLPYYIRYCRDLQYTPERRKGYVWMSNWLVPLMNKYSFVREIVNEFMIAPMSEHGVWMVDVGGKPHIKLNNFWMRTWEFIGKYIA